MSIYIRGFIGVLLLATLFACETDNSASPFAESEKNVKTDGDGIDWFDGTIDEAFAYAKHENKPLYFYWGAVWCPPCQEIKHTIFKHPKFLSQSQLFVPVYLDGDTERAQVQGERFAVQGYPTMIVFNSDGEELTRIPGGIDTRRYLDVLSLSLNQGRDMESLIASAMQSPQTLSGDELIQLAYYSWGQGNLSISDEQTLALLKSLALLDSDKNQLALSRLQLSYLAKQIDLDRDDLNSEEKQEFALRLQSLLSSPEQVLANIDYLSFYPAEIISLLDLEQSLADKLALQWVNSLDPQTRNPLLSRAEHLGKWLAPVNFYWLQNPEAEALPIKFSTAIEKEVQALNFETKGEERQSVINRAGNLLRAAKMYPQAKQLVSEEISQSKSPYYFMSSMAEIAEETDDPAGIVEWRQKAYQAAAGKATRFQWGVEYVSALIQHQPDDAELIVETALGLFDNLDRGSDVFSGRNYGRLNTLLETIKQWQSESRAETLDQFIAQIQILCDQTDGESRQYQQCNTLLRAEKGVI